MLKRALEFVPVALLACALPAAAQQVGDNVNVLPVYKTVSCSTVPSPTDPTAKVLECHWAGMDPDEAVAARVRHEDAVRGNLYGQRLNEPSILVSSRNKDHILVFFNDYRGVDEPVDVAIPSTQRHSAFANIWNSVRTFFARLAGKSAGAGQPGEKEHATFAQAGVGCSVSYDGGLTWNGCMVPGMPFDASSASKASPSYLRGLQGMSDPTVAAGKCGRGYLANIAYTYGQGSQMQVHTVQDMNDSDVLHTWEWKGIAALADCNNASWGCFVDKPAIATRPLAADSCDGSTVTEHVYATYTTFTGTTGTGNTKFQSKVNLAISTDGGRTFASQLVDGNYTQVQGTDVEVSPSGTVYVFFRSFNSPNSIIMRKSSSRGSGWEKPVDIVAAGAVGAGLPIVLQAFDQPTTDLATGGESGLTFRANAFPAAAITPDGGAIIVTFQEKADPSNGWPSATGTPRIMMTYSTDGGAHWSPRRAISYASNQLEPIGLGYFSKTVTIPGRQVQPAIVCGTNSSCLVTWMESKDDPSLAYGWIAGSDYNRTMNHRAMFIQINKDHVPQETPAASFQVSRYSYEDDTRTPSDNPGEVEKKLASDGKTPFPMWSPYNFNNYDGGRSPFDGDYTDVRALTPNTFLTAFTDNRYVVPPAFPSGASLFWNNFPTYSPWPQCPWNNPGSRAQTVMAAQISNEVVLTSATNYKDFPSTLPKACGATFTSDTGRWSEPTEPCIEFSFTAWNNTSTDKHYRIWLSGASPASFPGTGPDASFAKDWSPKRGPQMGVAPDPEWYQYKLKAGGLNMHLFSSNSANVYAFDNQPVTVNIAECPMWTITDPETGEERQLSSCTVLNPDGTPVLTSDPVYGYPTPKFWTPGTKTDGTPTGDPDYDAWITFNGTPSQPSSAVAPDAFAHEPSVVTVSGRNVSGRNVSGRNVSGRNVSGRNTVPANVYDNKTGELCTDTGTRCAIDYSVEITPTTDDDVGTYLSLFNVDEAYVDDYIFQVLVTKPLTSFTTVAVPGGCGEPFNATEGALVGQATVSGRNVSGRNVSGRNVSGRNVSGRNPVPVDGDTIAQTIQNTSFTLGSSRMEYLPLPAPGSGSAPQPPECNAAGFGRIGKCTLAAPRLPNTVTVTMRAYRVTQFYPGTPIYDPEVAPPSLAVAEYACKSDACLYESGPDLKVPDPLLDPPIDPSNPSNVWPPDVPAGTNITFPTAWVEIDNIGKDCGNGDPCGTARPHRWGIYLSEATNQALLPRYKPADCPAGPTQCVPGMIKENRTDFSDPVNNPITIFVAAALELLPNPLGLKAGESEYVESQTVLVPYDIPLRNPAGTLFYAYLYIDNERVVSELNEDNNMVRGGPITVRAGGYSTAGLLSPCGPGLACSRTGLGAVPLAWQFTQGSAVVDTQALRPTLVFYYSDSDWQQLGPIGSAVTPCAAGGTCDLSTGNSGFQYCNAAGTYLLCSTRPPSTWQYNWERKDPAGKDLAGYVILWIYPTAAQSCQEGSECAPGTAAIGPIRITLR